jgi:hypothetical protein
MVPEAYDASWRAKALCSNLQPVSPGHRFCLTAKAVSSKVLLEILDLSRIYGATPFLWDG